MAQRRGRSLLRPFPWMICVFVVALGVIDGRAQTPEASTAPAPGTAEPTPTQAAAPVVPAPGMQIVWEVRNRFRLFREERDFQYHVQAMNGRSVLGAEQTLEVESDGRGWARNMVGRLCIDFSGRVSEPCTRDGAKESYLTPTDHPVTVKLTGNVPVGAVCAWSFGDGESPPQQSTQDCGEAVNLRVPYGRVTNATVDISSGTETTQRATGDIQVRDLFIAGLGDSIASGEGNPDKPVALADEGFCFRSYLGGTALGGSAGEYFRPSRANFTGSRACETPDTSSNALLAWQRLGAQWLSAACHRSLYSYQTRTAIGIAVRYPHLAVTYLPLACSGATITEGLLGSLRARECLVTKTSMNCEGTVGSQVAELHDALNAARRRQPDRQLDLVLLSIGANDINFSGLVADVIVEKGTERALFQRSGIIGNVDDSRVTLQRELPQRFRRLRDALKPLVDGDLSHVLFVSYGNPTMMNNAPCPGGLAGFDIHPSFNADPDRLARASNFVQSEFLPQIRRLATCTEGAVCGERDAMTFVDRHQNAFQNHGFCARAQTDPQFDQQCFLASGGSFTPDIVDAANNPMTCGAAASAFRAYLPRARWIRDANDSYFTAMTYPLAARSSNQPADIHDATWGVLSAVYGGAIHPTAEGHAAMADAALPVAAAVLGLPAQPDVVSEPIPAVQ